jgi:hypothetical protein
MSLRVAVLSGAAAAAVLAFTAAPAQAERHVGNDARQDVAVSDFGGCPEVCPEITTKPDNEVVDVVRFSADHRIQEVRLAMTARALDPAAKPRVVAFWELLVPGGDRWQVALKQAKGGGTTVALTRNGDRVGCPGLTGAIDPARRLWSSTVPTGCIGTPGWVRAGGGLSSFKSAAESFLFDDALASKPSSGQRVRLSERLDRG